MDIRIFPFPAYKKMGRQLAKEAGMVLGSFFVERYVNGEMHVRLATDVFGKTCVVLGSIAPPDEQLCAVLLLAHTLKKEGAKKVILALPYLAYSRHDKNKKQESFATPLIGQLLAASGADEVVTIDVHSDYDIELFPIPLISLSPTELFSEVIHKNRLFAATIVAPDEGAIRRADALALSSQMRFPVAYITKKRTGKGITHLSLHGFVNSQVVIVDDMLDTGKTLLSCVEKVRGRGAKHITILVTHGLFTGSSWKELWRLGVERIYCTDTIPQVKKADIKRVQIISAAGLLSSYFQTHKTLTIQEKVEEKLIMKEARTAHAWHE